MLEQRTETEILSQIRQIENRMRFLIQSPQTKANRNEQRSLTERINQLKHEHWAFYGNW